VRTVTACGLAIAAVAIVVAAQVRAATLPSHAFFAVVYVDDIGTPPKGIYIIFVMRPAARRTGRGPRLSPVSRFARVGTILGG